MIIIYEIPMILIIILILCIIVGATAFVSNIIYILFGIMQIALILIGCVTFKKFILHIRETRRFYLLLPCILFLLFSFLGLYLCYEFFCMSENYLEVCGTMLGKPLLGQTYHVRLYPMIICFVTINLLRKMLQSTFEIPIRKSITLCIVCIVIIFGVMFGVYQFCNKKAYEKNICKTNSTYELKEDVFWIWVGINNSESRFPYFELESSELLLFYKLDAKTKVYLTGNDRTIHDNTYVEFFVKDKTIIGYIPIEKIQD